MTRSWTKFAPFKHVSRCSLTVISLGPKNDDFIPLKDLLKKNHGDRVSDYMDKMMHMSIDEIVNGRAQLDDPASP